MSHKKIVISIVIVLAFALVVLLVMWVFSGIGQRASETQDTFTELPVEGLLNFRQVEPLGLEIGFRVPGSWEMSVDGNGQNVLLSNNPEFKAGSGGIVLEIKGNEVLPAGQTLPKFLLGSFVKESAKVSTLGKTLGGFQVYRLDDISVSSSTGLAYAVDHGNGRFSFWQTSEYSELPVMEEIVMSTKMAQDKQAILNELNNQ